MNGQKTKNRIRKQNKKYAKLLSQAYYYFELGIKTKEVATIMKKSVARVNNWARKYREEYGIKSNRKDKIINYNIIDKTIVGLCRKWAYQQTKNYIEQHPGSIEFEMEDYICQNCSEYDECREKERKKCEGY